MKPVLPMMVSPFFSHEKFKMFSHKNRKQISLIIFLFIICFIHYFVNIVSFSRRTMSYILFTMIRSFSALSSDHLFQIFVQPFENTLHCFIIIVIALLIYLSIASPRARSIFFSGLHMQAFSSIKLRALSRMTLNYAQTRNHTIRLRFLINAQQLFLLIRH